MLNHFALGPTEQQTYSVAYMVPGSKVATIVYEHMNGKTAIEEAARLNREQVKRDQTRAERRIVSQRPHSKLNWRD